MWIHHRVSLCVTMISIGGLVVENINKTSNHIEDYFLAGVIAFVVILLPPYG